MRCRFLPFLALIVAVIAAPPTAKAGHRHYRPFVRTEFAACPPDLLTADAALAMEAPAEVAEYRLVTCRMKNVPATASVTWDVYPEDNVEADESADRLIFVAPPGRYRVQALVTDATSGKTVTRKIRAYVVIKGKAAPPAPPKRDKPADAATKDALGRIAFSDGKGTYSCTATVMLPRLADGGYHVLTASHCLPLSSGRGRMRCSNNKVYDVTIATIDRKPDVAWLIMSNPGEDLPAARLATAVPDVGSPVWHAGFGEHRPGNREDGEVGNFYDPRGRQGYILNVSSGDSGGAIFDDATGHVLGPVCCTDVKNVKTKMLAGNPAQCARLRPPVE